jgi:predicted nucleic acid-binding protein
MSKSTKSSTARSLFLDTSGYYALVVERDSQHDLAKRIMRQAMTRKQRFVTTDYVLTETANLLTARGYKRLVDPFFESIFSSRACTVEWMDSVRFSHVREFMRKHQDKDWSFTDCFSFWLMRQLTLRRAVTNDHHFRQAGFEPLLV